MNYKENKEIMDLIKHIKKINEQIKNPDGNIREVLADVQKSFPSESVVYEVSSVNGDMSKITTLENIDINILYSKLPVYKSFCEAELLKKCSQELYEEIKRKEMI